MKVKLIKKVTQGETNLSLFYYKDNEWVASQQGYGREITGHTCGSNNELISILRGSSGNLSYGKHLKTFLGIENIEPKECIKKIKEVKGWIKECDELDDEQSWESVFEI